MKIKVFSKVPQNVYIACSGGVDSMAGLTYLATKRNRLITPVFFHHNTEVSNLAYKFLQEYIPVLQTIYPNIQDLKVGFTTESPSKNREQVWRDLRYQFLSKFPAVVTCHHLDDQLENYVYSMLHGSPRFILEVKDNLIRPFLLTEKTAFYNWCNHKNINWVEDTSNKDNTYCRNRIRNVIIPEMLKIQPGLKKVVIKQLKDKNNV